MTTAVLEGAVRSLRAGAQVHMDNAAKASSSDSHAKPTTQTTSAEVAPSGKIVRVESNLNRISDPTLRKNHINAITDASGKQVIYEMLKPLESMISKGKDNNTFPLADSINKFFTAANTLKLNNNEIALRQNLLTEASDIGKGFSEASSTIDEIKKQTNIFFQHMVEETNNSIKSLFDFNRIIRESGSGSGIFHADKRDEMIRKLSTQMELKIEYKDDHTVNITKKNGQPLISDTSYTQFEYQKIKTNRTLKNNTGISSVEGTQYDRSHKSTGLAKEYNISSEDDGKWGAFINMHGKATDIGKGVRSLARNFVDQINKLHNNNSPYPPKTGYKSNFLMKGSNSYKFDSPFTVYALDIDGNHLKTSSGLVEPINFNFNDIPTNSANGNSPSISEIIAEINNKLNNTSSFERAAIGAIYNADDTQLKQEFLLNNMHMESRGEVNTDHEFTFDLKLEGNKYFGSEIEVLNVSYINNNTNASSSVSQDNLPNTFSLPKGENLSMNSPITLENITDPTDVTFDIRVKGENGEVSRGTVTYKITPGDLPSNKIISYDSNNVPPTTGGFDNPNLIVNTHHSIATAKLVDKQGCDVDPNSYNEGYLTIDANNSNYRLAIVGEEFNHFMGFNNLFEFDEESGAVSVNQEIMNDPRKLSIGKPQAFLEKKVIQKTAATLEFTDPLTIADNDTITIAYETPDGKDEAIFTYSGTNNTDDSNDKVGTADPLNNLVERINNHPSISQYVFARIEGNIITMTAKKAGSKNHTISVKNDFSTSGTTLRLNNAPATSTNEMPPIPVENLATTEEISRFNMNSNNNNFLDELTDLKAENLEFKGAGGLLTNSNTIQGHATSLKVYLATVFNKAKNDARVSSGTLTAIDQRIKEIEGIDLHAQLMKVFIASRHSSIIHTVIANHLKRNAEVLSEIIRIN